MSEDLKELKFVRLKTMPDDLIGYVTYKDQYLIIETPLRVEIETIYEEGRQILALEEYLPQSVIELREIEIDMVDVFFSAPVKKEFYEQYEYVCDFFYNNQHKLKEPKKFLTSSDTKETAEKVVSILDAMAKKDKGPVH
jgi:hypothetical protein